MMWLAIQHIILFSPLGAAFDHIPSPAFTFTGPSRLHQRGACRRTSTFQLQAQSTKKKNPLLELIADVALGRKGNSEEIESIEDFDADLASEIQDALNLAEVTDDDVNIEAVKEADALEETETVQDVPNQIMQPPKDKTQQNAAEIPPHTALAQVLANQHNIDIASISPASGSKITAEDVEFVVWKNSQPPCTPEALELAYSFGLDLRELYEDEELQLSDVQLYQELYQENVISLRMTTEVNRGKKRSGRSEKQAKKTRALDKQLEQGLDKLSSKARELAGSVTGNIVQSVKSQTQKLQSSASEKLRESLFADRNGRESREDITSVGDFDASLALEIQEALSSVNLDGEMAEDTGADAAVSSDRPTRKELQSMTCVQLKEQLRVRGMKVSGKKADLVERLCSLEATEDDAGDDDECVDDNGDGSPLFFATLR